MDTLLLTFFSCSKILIINYLKLVVFAVCSHVVANLMQASDLSANFDL